MKKFVAIALLFFSVPAFAISELLEPQWNEFCPEDYLSASDEIVEVSYKDSSWWDRPLFNKNKIRYIEPTEEEKYWHNRKIIFLNNIQNCKAVFDNNKELLGCYEYVKQGEYAKNNALNESANQANYQNQLRKQAISQQLMFMSQQAHERSLRSTPQMHYHNVNVTGW